VTIVVAALALVVFVLCGVVLELFRDVRQLRDAAGILDRPLDIEIGTVAGARPSSIGLPDVLDATPSALVVFLSDRCGTCRSIAAALGGRLPPLVWVVLEARSPESAEKFIESYELASLSSAGMVLVDADGTIAGRIGLDVTPAGFRVEDGRIASATTVPSKRYLLSIAPKPVRLRRPDVMPKEREAWEASEA
jgi:hypothetical protein